MGGDMGRILDRAGLRGREEAQQPGVHTEAQREAARALVAKFVATGAVRRNGHAQPKPAPPPKPVKPAFDLHVACGRAVDEPFGKLTLMRQLGVANNVAANLLAAWKRRGWVEANGAGHVRTADFGKEEQDRYNRDIAKALSKQP